MSDEEIIKQRLIIDGDGTGDDRRINMLIKQFLKWTSTKIESPETNQMLYDRILAQTAQCQIAAAKSELTSKMIGQEIKNYGKLSDEIEKNIELAKEEIEHCKQELALAKEIRKNKMVYDLLAKIIKQEPDREETRKQIETLKKELDELMEKSVKLDRKLDKRRKDLALLFYAVRELEEQGEESSDDEDMKPEVEELGSQPSTNTKASDDESTSTSQSAARKRKAAAEDKDSKKSSPDEESKEAILVDEELLELSLDKDDEEEKSAAS